MSSVTQPSEMPAVEAQYARPLASSRRPRRWWAIGAVVVVVVALVAWLAISRKAGMTLIPAGANRAMFYTVKPVDLHITLTEDGELKPAHSIELKDEVEGQTTIRFIVAESTRVKKGDLLVELASDKLTERIDSAEFEIKNLQDSLDTARTELNIERERSASEIEKAETALMLARTDKEKYVKGDYPKAKKAIEISIEETKLRLDRKEEELNKNEDLAERGFVTKAKIDQIKLEKRTLELELQQHELSMKILEEYERPMMEKRLDSATAQAESARKSTIARMESQVKKAKDKVKQLEDQLAMKHDKLARLKDQLAKCKIVAPTDGIVQYPDSGWSFRGGDQVTVGSQVYLGQTLVVLPDTSKMVVSTRVHEADRHKITEGMQCLVTVAAVPDQTFTGHVTKIARFADSANRWLNPDLKEHTTEIELDPTDAPLSPGDSAKVVIFIDHISGALAVPVQSVYVRGARSFVFVDQGGRTKPVEVKVGAATDDMIQIVSGVAAGQRVHLNPDERLVAMLPAPDTGKPGPVRAGKRPKRPARAHGNKPTKPTTPYRTSEVKAASKTEADAKATAETEAKAEPATKTDAAGS